MIVLNRQRIYTRPSASRTNDRRRPVVINLGDYAFNLCTRDAIDLANQIADALDDPTDNPKDTE